jgi:hypothetical protein
MHAVGGVMGMSARTWIWVSLTVQFLGYVIDVVVARTVPSRQRAGHRG